MINTILVEDDIYMQKHFSGILGSDERFNIAGTFRDAFDVESRCGTDIDLVLMDVLTLHKHSGLAAGKRIKDRYPHIKIVIDPDEESCRPILPQFIFIGPDHFPKHPRSNTFWPKRKRITLLRKPNEHQRHTHPLRRR